MPRMDNDDGDGDDKVSGEGGNGDDGGDYYGDGDESSLRFQAHSIQIRTVCLWSSANCRHEKEHCNHPK